MGDTSTPHSFTAEETFRIYETGESGLSKNRVSELLTRYGENSLPLAPPKPAWQRFLSQFHNVLIYVLLVAAVLSGLLEHYVDSGVIFAVVFVNAIVGFIQEGKAEDSLRAIMSMARSQCMVIREGVVETIDSTQLVPGDIVMMQAGDRVPADIRLFFSKDFRCDESQLTGEAAPVGKHVDSLSETTPLAERKNMAFMGSMVTYGMARGIVTQTALKTQIGLISEMVGKVVLVQTPLQIQLARFAHQLTIAIIIVSILTMIMGVLLHDYALSEMFKAAIGIAVSAIPEGLPAIVTIALAIGVQRMSYNKALVRRLPSVEVLGSVDVICSDKTGTLTANAMTAREVFTTNGRYRITGEGYKPEGAIELTETSEKILMGHDDRFTQACIISGLCNDARVVHKDSGWELYGDPTEGALLVLALKHGMSSKEIEDDWPRVDLLPFESENRYMATLHHNIDDRIMLCVKGAPERVLSFASHQLGDDGPEVIDQQVWSDKMHDIAKHGMRVMALAKKSFDRRPDAVGHEEVESGLCMVALVGISDPPRPEAITSVHLCHSAGVTVKMITGDSPVTAGAIGAELGLNVERILTGQDIDAMSEDELAKEVVRTDVFARTSPANKLQLVNALQQHEHTVAMTGDGVNDSPALKQANIGVAMGLKGTDAAKEAADFVLTDDNFSTIALAIKEGRTVYDNIVKSIIFILPTNLAEALVIFLAITLGQLLPITPAQILWVNMITAITLALALAFEHSERHVMARPPRPYGQGLFSAAVIVRMVLVGGMGAAIVFGLFFHYQEQGASIEYARTVAVNALVMVEVFYLFNCRLLHQSIFTSDFIKGSKPMIIASVSVILFQLIYSYLPVSQRLFGLESITASDWMLIVMVTAPVMIVVEIEKWFHRMIVGNNNNHAVVQPLRQA